MIWRLHWFEWMFIVLLLTMISLMATAEEQAPCRPDGDTVVCQRAAFDKLVGKLIDADAEAKKLTVRLDAVVKDREDVENALTACLSKPPPEPVVIKPTALRSIGPVVLATVGALIAGVAVTGDFDARGRGIGAVVGLSAVGGAVVWALP